MASVEIIIREDATGTNKLRKKGGPVVSRVITTTGLKTGQERATVVEALAGAIVATMEAL